MQTADKSAHSELSLYTQERLSRVEALKGARGALARHKTKLVHEMSKLKNERERSVSARTK